MCPPQCVSFSGPMCLFNMAVNTAGKGVDKVTQQSYCPMTVSHMHASEPTPNSPVVEVEGLRKQYGAFTAIEDLNFTVQPGQIVGLVGANGAGKTTTLRAITGILRPTAGCIRVAGFDIAQEPVAAKRRFAYIPDTIHPYELLTVTEHLHFVALAYHLERAEDKYAGLLEELELTEKRDAIASTLSRGMLQKLALACAFLREPQVIILDEPLTGLDPRGIRNMKDSIRRRAAQGTAFLLSSHLLMLVEALCDQVLILHRGKKRAFGSLQTIRGLATLNAAASLEDVFFAVTESPPAGSDVDGSPTGCQPPMVLR